MLGKRLQIGLLSVILLLGLAGISWRFLPRLATALPGRIQHRLPPELLALVMTPLPTALPAPAITAVPPRITIPPLPTATAVPPTAPPITNTPVTNSPVTSTPTPQPTATPSPTPLPAAARIEGLTNMPQKFNNCGPTNLSLTLNFYGHAVDQLEIAAVLKPNYDDRNVSPEELAAYVNENTPLRAGVYSGGDLALLKRFIATGFPVIIEKGLLPSQWEGWMGHYLTVYGYDDTSQTFTSMDTFLGPWDGNGRIDSYETVAEFWSHFNYTFVLVYPPERETAVHLLLAPHLRQPLTMWQYTAQIAQAGIDADSENAFAWFNLGTSLSRLGELTGQRDFYENAAAAFDQARTIGLPRRMLWYQFQPYEAYLAVDRHEDVLTLIGATEISEGGRNVEETYLYQGHALLAKGDEAGARSAYQRALQLNPNFTLAQQACAGGLC